MLPNLPQTHLAIWGGQAAGIAFAINPLLEPAAIAELLSAGEAKVLVTLAPFPAWTCGRSCSRCSSRSAASNTSCWSTWPAGPRVSRPGLARGAAGASACTTSREGLRRQPTDRLISGRVIRPDDRSSYFCTGGTTGTPKIAMRTHANEVANAWSVGQFLGDGIARGKTIFCGLPLFHVNGVLVTGLLPFSRGAHVILGTPRAIAATASSSTSGSWSSTTGSTSSAAFRRSMRRCCSSRRRVATSVRSNTGSAAPRRCRCELMRAFQELTGLKILEGYGLTEGTCVSTCNPPLGERRIGSIGLRLPLQDMKAVVLDDAGAYVRDCAVGEVGRARDQRAQRVRRLSGLPDRHKGLWLELGDGGAG